VRHNPLVLSDELDLVPYPRRISALMRLLRQQQDPGERIAELAAGGPHERYLAVVAAAGLGARPPVVRALRDPDPSVRAEATRQALRLGWASGADLLADAPPVLRHLILRLMRKRPGSGDAVIDMVRDRYGDREAVIVLAACGPQTVARLLPVLARSVISWKVLARRHSAVVVDWVAAALAGGAAPDWAPVVAAVRACTPAQPARVLALLEQHTPAALPDIDLAPLAARFPARVAALAIRTVTTGDAYRHLDSRVLRHLLRLGAGELAALDAITSQVSQMLPPDRRGEVYAARPHEEVPWEGRVALLPEPMRTREVRRVLALPAIAANGHLTRRWSRYLPAAEALPVLDEAVRDPDPYSREEAYRAMAEVAGREPAALPEVLTRLLRLRNEREKVRLSVFSEMRTLAPHLAGSVAPLLTAITDAAIEARDCSPRTREVLAELAYDVLAARPSGSSGPGAVAGWALGLIARLPVPYYLETPLRPGQEHLVTAALRKRLAADTGELFELVRLLAVRARHVPELQDLLRRAAGTSSMPDVRATAAELWLDDPRTRASRAAELLRADLSAARLPAVWREIAGWSTDLLDTVLREPALAGPPVHIRRWAPRQQRAYATAVAAVATDTELDQRARTVAVKHLARVPVAGRELLGEFLDSPEVPIVEAALTALPWTDRPGETLPVLLGHAGGDRARVALPAADRAVRFVSAPELLALLRGLLLAPPSSPVRVSSRKAAVRILARYGPPESAELLAEVWHTREAHPDVRAVVVTALLGAKLTPSVWKILTEAARSTELAEVRALLGVVPPDLAEPDRRRFAALVVTACASPHRKISQHAFGRLAPWLRWAPTATGLIVGALADPEFTRPPLYWPHDSVRSLIAAMLDLPAGPGPSALASVFDRLIAHDRDDMRSATPDRDRPARRLLARIVGDAAHWARTGPAGDPEPVRAAARGLASHPGFLGDGAELLLALAGTDPAHLSEVADLVAARPALAVRLAAQLAATSVDAAHHDRVLAAARQLGDRTDLAGGLFALSLVTAVGRAQWTEAARQALHRLRDHPDPDVADAALRQTING
jgi:hypothetical protein